jgi:prophage tail gpP-like protein
MRGFRTYECTVRGHGQTLDDNRLLYALNTIARVRDDVCLDSEGNPLDEDMLVVGIEFRRSRAGGTLTRLRLVPLGSLLIEPDA